MSLTHKIQAALQKKSHTARERYIAALRGGDAEAILAAATAANVLPEQVDVDVELLDKAAAIAVEVNQLPKLEKASVAATQAAKNAADELERVVKPLEAKAESTAYEAGEADKNLRACRASVNALRGLYQEHPHLLPAEQAPTCIREQWKREGTQQAADKIKADALGAFNKAMGAVANARLQRQQIAMGRLPTNVIVNDPHKFGSDPAIASQAQTIVEQAEVELATALKAAIAAGYPAIELDTIIYQLPT